MHPNPEPPPLTPPQAATFLGVSTSTLAHWRQTGVGPPCVRLSRNVVRYRHADLLQFLQLQTEG